MHKQFEVTTDFSIGGFATCCVGNLLAFWWMTVTFPDPGDGTLLTLGVLAIAYVVGLVSNFCYVAWRKSLMEEPLREEYFRSTGRREREEWYRLSAEYKSWDNYEISSCLFLSVIATEWMGVVWMVVMGTL